MPTGSRSRTSSSPSPTASPLVKPDGVATAHFKYANEVITSLTDKLTRLREFVRTHGRGNPAEVDGYRDIYIHRDHSNTATLNTNIKHLAKLLRDTKRKLKSHTEAPAIYLNIFRAMPLSYFCMDGITDALANAIYQDDDPRNTNVGWDRTRPVEANIGDMISRYANLVCNDIRAHWERGTVQSLRQAERVYLTRLSNEAVRRHVLGIPVLQGAIGLMYAVSIKSTLDKMIPILNQAQIQRRKNKNPSREDDIMNMTQEHHPAHLACPADCPTLDDIQKKIQELLDRPLSDGNRRPKIWVFDNMKPMPAYVKRFIARAGGDEGDIYMWSTAYSKQISSKLVPGDVVRPEDADRGDGVLIIDKDLHPVMPILHYNAEVSVQPWVCEMLLKRGMELEEIFEFYIKSGLFKLVVYPLAYQDPEDLKKKKVFVYYGHNNSHIIKAKHDSINFEDIEF